MPQKKLYNAWEPNTGELTMTEMRVITAVADGFSNKEIAARHRWAISTVKKHLSNIFDKTGCDSRLQLGLRYAPRSRAKAQAAIIEKHCQAIDFLVKRIELLTRRIRTLNGEIK